MIKPKKHLGQHFLRDENIAKKIADLIPENLYNDKYLWIEVGPGMGVLTKYILTKNISKFIAVEIDSESVEYLKIHYPKLSVLEKDFLSLDFHELLIQHQATKICIIGNFPYHISSQIFIKIFENFSMVESLIGMFQKEVCERVLSGPNNKSYGILSVYIQTFFNGEYLFTVPPQVFNPPPNVNSGVIQLVKNSKHELFCDNQLFVKLIRTTFNQRRKMLRNTLKAFIQKSETWDYIKDYVEKRPENLSSQDFEKITQIIQKF